jgi:hypothetical protein
MRSGISDEARINITEALKIDSSRIPFQVHLVFALVHKRIRYINFTLRIFTTVMHYPKASVIIKFGKAS